MKNNLWNKIFHKKELDQYLNQLIYGEQILHDIQCCKSLLDLLALHKFIYPLFPSPNIGPDKYGMFRTSDISTMTPDQVFLGNIYGLWTKPITYWENYKEETLGGFGMPENLKIYDIILGQYKLILYSNVENILKSIQ
jgi:hypothetical protein